MEYENFLVSLYDNLSLKGLPIAFIEVKKESDKVKLKLNLFKSKKGFLFIYLQDKCYLLNLESGHEFIFNDEFYNQNEYLFCIKYGLKTLYGESGNVTQKQEKLKKIDLKYSKVLDELKQDAKLDKNKLVDDIVKKMFGKTGTLFYDQTKKQLQTIFSSSKRAKFLEEEIPMSKFVVSEMGSDAHFAGIVYRDNSPYAIAVGHKESFDNLALKSGDSYQFYKIPQNKRTGGDAAGVFLTFRRASDSDVVYI